MELEVFFQIIQQTYSKLVISFMNRKSSCGYATHFFYWFQFLIYLFVFRHKIRFFQLQYSQYSFASFIPYAFIPVHLSAFLFCVSTCP
jgi:hypothetical protein